MSKGPLLIDLEDEEEAAPDRAPPVPEAGGPPEGRAMRAAMAGLARRPSWLARAFWVLALALFVRETLRYVDNFCVQVAAYKARRRLLQ